MTIYFSNLVSSFIIKKVVKFQKIKSKKLLN